MRGSDSGRIVRMLTWVSVALAWSGLGRETAVGEANDVADPTAVAPGGASERSIGAGQGLNSKPSPAAS